MFCPTPPCTGLGWGLVGDLINEFYHVLFVNDTHCFNAQIPYQAWPSPIRGGGGQNIDRCISDCGGIDNIILLVSNII